MAHGAYMPFSSQYHDAVFVGAHVMKVVSYASVLVGLLASVYVTFRREEEVAETTREANTALAREIDFRRKAERADGRSKHGDAEFTSIARPSSHTVTSSRTPCPVVIE